MISLKKKTFSRFFIAFLKFTLNLEYFEKKDQSHSLSITEIINCKTGSDLNVKKAIFHATLRRGLVNVCQTLLRSARNQFHTTPLLILVRRSRKMLVLVISELLEQFVNILTADYQYSR